ncbi:FHA domain-containing protein [Salisaeta longa]|uniref:FHA domain-containing protein n=1 Tax=Salisaeta longa TaxID=503170 RepID=UPI0003B49B89|nr:FHA domain-containing protein [Salisaeta longa]
MNQDVHRVKALLWIACWGLLLATPSFGQATISDIASNPGKFSDTSVEVEGTVSRHVNTGATTDAKHYMLQGQSGEQVRVKTTDALPAVGTKYRVGGLVSISPINRVPVIVEQSRTPITTPATTAAQQSSGEEVQGEGIPLWALLLMFLVGATIVVGIGYFAFTSSELTAIEERQKRKKQAQEAAPQQSAPSSGGGAQRGAPARIKSESSSSVSSQDGGPKTLRFKAPPKTMKFIPGKLVVTAGPDQGKEFRIAGHPTPEGNVVTIGRSEVDGERAFSHIQLGDTYRTVSRIQGEIIQQDQDVYFRNKSTTNPTVVNGSEVPADTKVELKDGDMIRMGELVMRYETE